MKPREIPALGPYLLTWAALLVLLGATVASAYVPMGMLNAVANVGVALIKMILIMLVFMHLREAPGVLRLFAAGGFVWLALLVGLSMADYLTRPHLPAPF